MVGDLITSKKIQEIFIKFTIDKLKKSCYNINNKSLRPLIQAHLRAFCFFRSFIMPKDFKTIDEQLAILEERGLTVDDEKAAKDFLKYNNYYRISGYSLTLRNHDRFYSSATMQNIIDIYYFDHALRTNLFNIITKIEVNIKSIYSYYFTQKYGSLGYLDKNNFNDSRIFPSYDDIINKVHSIVKVNTNHEEYLKHFQTINEKIPFWAYIESFTLSDLSKLYSISEYDIQVLVAREFGLNSNNNYKIMCNYLYCLAFLRNICAHGGRLYNRKFNTKPNLNKREKALLLIDKNGYPENSMLFGFVINIKRLAQPKDWQNFKNKLILLCKEYPFVNMCYYGFCTDWEKYL